MKGGFTLAMDYDPHHSSANGHMADFLGKVSAYSFIHTQQKMSYKNGTYYYDISKYRKYFNKLLKSVINNTNAYDDISEIIAYYKRCYNRNYNGYNYFDSTLVDSCRHFYLDDNNTSFKSVRKYIIKNVHNLKYQGLLLSCDAFSGDYIYFDHGEEPYLIKLVNIARHHKCFHKIKTTSFKNVVNIAKKLNKQIQHQHHKLIIKRHHHEITKKQKVNNLSIFDKLLLKIKHFIKNNFENTKHL